MNFASRHVLVIFTLAVVESFVVDQIPISVFIAFIAFSQFRSSLSKFQVKYIPKSLNGLGSMEKPVRASISGWSMAFPNRAYFVLSTFV